MKMIRLLLIIAALSVTACNNGELLVIEGKSVHVIGDSLCNVTYEDERYYLGAWPELLGISHNCVSGRPVFGGNPFYMPNVDLIILALGTNDRRQETSDDFRVAYQALLDRVHNDVLCILPNYEREAQVIRELCASVLQGVPADAFDGVHYTMLAQNKMASIVGDWLDNYTGGLDAG